MDKIQRYIKFLLLILSLYFIVSLFLIVFSRVDILFVISSYEDATLQMAMRILEGKPLYGDNFIEFVPMIYGPILFYLVAFSSWILEPSLMAARIPSLLSLILLPFVIYKITSRIYSEDGLARDSHQNLWKNIPGSIFATGLFYSAYAPTGFMLDLPKVDAIFLLLVAASIYLFITVLKKGPNFSRLIPLGVVSGSLFFAKQTGLAYFVFYSVAILFFFGIRPAIIMFLFGAITLAVPVYLLEMQPGNQFLLYNVIIPSKHSYWKEGVYEGLVWIVGPTGIIALILLVQEGLAVYRSLRSGNGFYAIIHLLRNDSAARDFLFYTGLFFTSFVISYIGRLKIGANSNSFLYVLFAISIVILRYFSMLRMDNTSELSSSGKGMPMRYAIASVAVVLLGVQFVSAFYNVFAEMQKVNAIKELQASHKEDLCALDGNPLLFHASVTPAILCGKRPFFVYASIADIVPDEEKFEDFLSKFKLSVESKEISMIIADQETHFAASELQQAIFLIKLQETQSMDKKELRRLRSFRKTLELNLYISTHFRMLGQDELTEHEKNYIQMENMIQGKKQFRVLKPI